MSNRVTNIPELDAHRQHVRARGDSPHADFRGIADAKLDGFVAAHKHLGDNGNASNGNREFFEVLSPKGYAIGVNILLCSP